MAGELTVGQVAVLRAAPVKFQRYRGRPCEVLAILRGESVVVANIRVDDGSETGVELHSIPVHYLAPPPQRRRRGVLNLHVVEDDRSEAEKQAEVREWFEARGYIVHAPDNHRSAAVCWQCTREARQKNPGAKPQRVFCPVHKRPVFSPDTGGDEGIPDLHITHSRWPEGAWTVIEMKQDEKSDRREAQVALVEAGRSTFCWSLTMAIQWVYGVECRIGVDPHPDMVAYLAERMAA